MAQSLSKLLKTWLVCTALAASALAMALPTPKDIEAAVSQGQLTQAETLLREVIAAKPQSAKAHYQLAQVLLGQNRLADARAELSQARSIDPSLKFASSDKHFQDLMERTQAKAAAPQSASVQASPPAAEPSERGFSMTAVWIGMAGIALLALLMRMNRPGQRPPQTASPTNVPQAQPPFTSTTAPAAQALSTAFGRNPTPGMATAPAGHAPATAGYPAANPPAAPSGGSTVAGAVVGGLAGVAAGYALSKALESHHPSNAPEPTPTPAPSGNNWADNQGHVSAEPQRSVPDFDAGTGSGWDDSAADDLGFGADDNW